jgi:glycerophosphoryl diester phosphodiesterase
MNKIFTVALVSFGILVGCKSSQLLTLNNPDLPVFDSQGHRGARGLMPENTIPAMRKAIDLGMTTIEMDCHITKDKVVVVTHDPHINPLYARKPDGTDLTKEEGKKYAIYDLNYAEVREFQMGTKPYDLFPQQQKVKTYIPRLAELIDSVQTYLQVKNLPQVFYNIETKSSDKGDNKLHPAPAEFVRLLVKVIADKKITPWVVIQSFDPRTLQEIHRQYPQIKTSLLISNQESFENNLQKLGFTPTVYSPNVKLVTAELVQKCHAKNIKIVPWTANTKEEIVSLKALGVDGIISDYPNLLAEIK